MRRNNSTLINEKTLRIGIDGFESHRVQFFKAICYNVTSIHLQFHKISFVRIVD